MRFPLSGAWKSERASRQSRRAPRGWSWPMSRPVFPAAMVSAVFFITGAETAEIYTLSLHDALPISARRISHLGWYASAMSFATTSSSIGSPTIAVRIQDRKSTRLNSSHSQISYAVFCLKKKMSRDDAVSAERRLEIRARVAAIAPSAAWMELAHEPAGLSSRDGLRRFFYYWCGDRRDLHSFPTRRSSDLRPPNLPLGVVRKRNELCHHFVEHRIADDRGSNPRSEEHTSELQSQSNLVCRLLLEKKNVAGRCGFR